MKKSYFVILIMVLAVSIGETKAQSVSNEQTKPMQMDHSHLPIAVPTNVKEPALSLVLNKDTMSGYNLHLKIQNYHLTPHQMAFLVWQILCLYLSIKKQVLLKDMRIYI